MPPRRPRPLGRRRGTRRSLARMVALLVGGLLLQGIGGAAVRFALPSGDRVEISEWKSGRMVEWYPNGTKLCDSWVLVPAENMWHPALRGVLYLLALVYTFVGVAVVSDSFMRAIEKITADEEVEKVNDATGETFTLTTTRWNPTVANLSLLALGSSAPEILLSLIETVQTLDSEPGELGPSTIVGSAAFNLLVISGICVAAVEEPKKIEEFGVFVLTASASLFAYFWMIVTLNLWTECEVTLVEALLTLAFFPMLIILAYLQDQGLLVPSAAKPPAEADEAAGGAAPEHHGGKRASEKILSVEMTAEGGEAATDAQIEQLWHILKQEKAQLEADDEGSVSAAGECSFAVVLQELYAARQVRDRKQTMIRARPSFVRSRHRGAEAEAVDVNDVAFARGASGVALKAQGSRAVLKRNLSNGAAALNVPGTADDAPPSPHAPPAPNQDEPPFALDLASPPLTATEMASEAEAPRAARTAVEWVVPWVYLEPGADTARLVLIRHGGTGTRVTVKFATADGSAMGGVDYTAANGHAILEKGVTQVAVSIGLIKRDATNPRAFSVQLVSPGGGATLGRIVECVVHLDSTATAPPAVEFLGYYHPRVRYVDEPANENRQTVRVVVEESIGKLELAVGRRGSLKGTAVCKVSTAAINAVEGEDYGAVNVDVRMEEGQAVQVVQIPITDTRARAKDVCFTVVVDKGEGAEVGEAGHCGVQIVHDNEWRLFHARIEELIAAKKAPVQETTWKDQFQECFEVQGESISDHWFHFFTFFWRCLCAFIPPPSYLGGWVAFVVTLGFIAVITVVVIELANLLGCCVGLKNSVTAISFVALGTSLPDTFASKTTAEDEDTADAAVGNVTGSNCVNIFLGLGLPWTVAATYKQIQGEVYFIPAGDLVYSVILFLCCATIGLGMLVGNRVVYGGELGGPRRYIIAGLFVVLWLVYLIMSALKAYGHVGASSSTAAGARTC